MENVGMIKMFLLLFLHRVLKWRPRIEATWESEIILGTLGRYGEDRESWLGTL